MEFARLKKEAQRLRMLAQDYKNEWLSTHLELSIVIKVQEGQIDASLILKLLPDNSSLVQNYLIINKTKEEKD